MSNESYNQAVTTGWRAGLFFLLLTAAATYPLVDVFEPAVPDFDDAQFSVWRLSWVAHQLPRDPLHLFDANIFFPELRTLAYSDAMLALGVAGAPLIWLGVHPVVVHNVLLLAAIAGSGLAAWALAAAVTGDRHAALAAGVIFALAPYRFGHIGHLELQWAVFMPLTLLVLHRVSAEDHAPPWRYGFFAGVLLALQGLSSLYYAVYFSIVLFVWIALAVTLVLHSRTRLLQACAVAGITAALLLAPYLAVYVRAGQVVGVRTGEEIQQFSALPSDYLRVSASSRLLPQQSTDAQDERSLYPGATAAALALIALAFGSGRMRLIYAAVTLLAVDLSFGANGLTYPLLLRLAPALAAFRAPARFGVIVTLGLGVLASIGACELRRRVHSRIKPLIIIAVVGFMLIEYWCAPLWTRRVPLEPSNLYRWLATQPPAVVLELPMPTAGALWGYETSYQFMSIYHWQSLVNGYSGFAADSYFQTLEAIDERNRDRVSERLQTLGVDYVVIHEHLLEPASFADTVSFFSTLPAALPPQTFVDPNDPTVVVPIGRR